MKAELANFLPFPVLFVNPGFFKEIRAVWVYRRICDRCAVIHMQLSFVALVVDVLEDQESKCRESD